MSGDDAFFLPTRDGYQATDLTRGPWDPHSQHAGPPTALIGREIERLAASDALVLPDTASARVRESPNGEDEGSSGWLVGRLTCEILRPIPIDVMAVTVRVVRPGRRVCHVEAELHCGSGEEVVRARAWLVRRGEIELPAGFSSEDEQGPSWQAARLHGGFNVPPAPGPSTEIDFFPMAEESGYHTAMEVRFAEGSFLDPGPATAWMRMGHPLVAGERPSPLQRVLVAADSGSGVGATLDSTRYLFMNVDLSVHLHRMPSGEWVCLKATTTPEPTGLGVCDTALYDERGPIGRAVQTLLIAERDR